MARFPRRTVLLMVLALVVFGRLWCITRPSSDAPADAPADAWDEAPVDVRIVPPADAGTGG